jgi:membrane protease YdiL (CAAX protease family)
MVVFVVFPVLLIPFRVTVGRWLIPILVVTAAGCVLVLLSDPTFDRRRLWNPTDLGDGLRRILRLVPVGAVALVALTLVIDSTRLLGFARERPLVWLVVLVLYPVLSVYPQEVIFRTFFFHRHARLIGDERWVIVVSAVTFGLAHAFLWNWIAPVLGTIGGILFATTYQRSGSTLQACLEHALWGDLVFTVGLGWYFYGGSL